MQTKHTIFLTKFLIFFLTFIQSFNCQANNISLQKADSLFSNKNYKEALELYEQLFEIEEAYSPAMVLKMAFITEGMGDFSKASFYLAKFYDLNPNPRVITKIKTLTEQSRLMGYELSDKDRFFQFLSDLQLEITASLAFLLVSSLILLVIFKQRANKPIHYIPSILLILLIFLSNNFLSGPNTGIITGSPTLIMDQPTSAGNLIENVDPGHRVVIKSTKDIWYEINWGNKKAYIKKESVTKL